MHIIVVQFTLAAPLDFDETAAAPATVAMNWRRVFMG
jgi:hypothetical protein